MAVTAEPPQSADAVEQPRRALFFFLDGTSNGFNDAETNVLKAYQLLDTDTQAVATDDQLAYYQSGNGTIAVGSTYATPSTLESAVTMALGGTVDHHVELAYTWLCQNYKYNDKIYILGFSRGAVPKAFAAFSKARDSFPPANDNRTKQFRRSAYQIAQIHFLGLWDTVASVHTVESKNLPGTGSLVGCKHVVHAMSLDDDRMLFVPQPVAAIYHTPELERMSGDWKTNLQPSLDEFWFAGTHGDVGGGSPTPHVVEAGNYQPYASNVPLRWMLNHLRKRGARMSLRQLAGDSPDPKSPLPPWLTQGPASYYDHMFDILHDKVSSSSRKATITKQEKVDFVIELGALVDSLSVETLQQLALDQDPHGLQIAARAALEDAVVQLGRTSTAFHVMAMDYKHFLPTWLVTRWGRDSTATDLGDSPKQRRKLHASVRSRATLSKSPYLPKATFYNFEGGSEIPNSQRPVVHFSDLPLEAYGIYDADKRAPEDKLAALLTKLD